VRIAPAPSSAPSKEDLDNVTCHKPLYYLGLVAGTTGLEPATSAVTGQRSNQLSYVPKVVFNKLGYRSHRIKRFAAFAIFARFYLLRCFGLNFRLRWTTCGHRNRVNATTALSLSDEVNLGSHCPDHRTGKLHP
jgi:hypothetical protein